MAKYNIPLPNGTVIHRPVGKLKKTHAMICELPGDEYSVSLYSSEDAAVKDSKKDPNKYYNDKWKSCIRHVVAITVEE
jgi:hypothetical protein